MLYRRLSPSFLSRLRKLAPFRSYSHETHTVVGRSRWTGRTIAGASVLAASTLALSSTPTDDLKPEPSLGSLIRSYTVYTMCSFPSLVDASPRILSVMSSVPGLRQITEAFVRVTFFDQVC